MNKQWFQGKIIKGDQTGQLLGFPTLNLDNPSVLAKEKEGVYAVRLVIDERKYNGVLFFGPRLIKRETKDVLEIHVFAFSQKIYGEIISFQLVKYLRKPINFSDPAVFQKQLNKDCVQARKILL